MAELSGGASQRSHLLRRRPLRVPRLGERGRVVMLVDNGVVGDSRVQKQARSMADRGWDVILLGRLSRNDRRDLPAHWRLGDARVRLLRFDEDMQRPRRTMRRTPRRSRLRNPLAYPGPAIARHRETEVVSRISELRYRIAETHGRRTPRAVVARQRYRLRLRWTMRVLLPWVQQRRARTSGQGARPRSGQAGRPGLSDRFTTWWWTRVLGRDAWRRLDPGLLEFEAVYGPVIDDLAPDIIHANDYRMLGVAARARTRAAVHGRDVKLVWDAHEFLPGLERKDRQPRRHTAHVIHERRFAPYADAVVTVTEGLADALQAEHQLRERPTVVLNAPVVGAGAAGEPEADIRAACGLAADVPLLVYTGFVALRRGVETMVEALPELPGVHVVLVVSFPVNRSVQRVQQRADELGVGDRLHLLPYVPVDQIVGFLRTATVGVFPGHRNPNHDLALPTKLFEYAHAGLPVLVSDVRDTAEAVRRHGIGEVFLAQDTADYVRAARRLLADLDHYRAAYERMDLLDEWTWERQADLLDEVYQRVRGGVPAPRAI